ncbi:MAG: hypothetical protein ACRDQ4_19755 [Pseudonocardiaceae bacterium]
MPEPATGRRGSLALDMAGYLRHACSTGASLRSIAKAIGLGWTRLRRELDAAGTEQSLMEVKHG